jgi:sulfopyruvate decarboxylase subunit beta
MIRHEAVKIFTDLRKDEIVVTGVGLSHHELFAYGHKDTNFYSIQLGYTVPVSLGLALAIPQAKIVALEGDGSMLAGVGSLTTVGSENPGNLLIIVFDNESYDAPSRFPSATARGTDLEAVARASGIKLTATVADLGHFKEAVKDALSQSGPWFIVAKVQKGLTLTPLPILPFDKTENAVLFRRALINSGMVKSWQEAYKIYTGIK